MENKEKSYLIKVPVYTTEMIPNPNDFFGGISYSDMLGFLKRKIVDYKDASSKFEFENRNKTRRTVIDNINFTEHPIGETSCLLLKIAAYSTNFYDGYLEAERKINFQKNYKIGSETNFVMIYPVINGIDSNNYTRYFVILIYEDPTKNSEEIIRITKTVLNNILKIPIANIKLPSILHELKSIGIIPELQLKFSAVHNDENSVDIKYRQYLVHGKLKQQKEENFKDIPFTTIEELLNEQDIGEYQKKQVKLVAGKNEYKIITEMRKEANAVVNETAEKIFNASTAITENELNTELHTESFVLKKLVPILSNFLSVDYES